MEQAAEGKRTSIHVKLSIDDDSRRVINFSFVIKGPGRINGHIHGVEDIFIYAKM
jgi:hypothetical protein